MKIICGQMRWGMVVLWDNFYSIFYIGTLCTAWDHRIDKTGKSEHGKIRLLNISMNNVQCLPCCLI